MPLYDLIDSDTGESQEVMMSWNDLQIHLSQNPTLSQIISAPALISGISGVTHKVDSGFNDVLQRVAAANPHSPIADQYGPKGIRESKTRDAVKKQKAKQAIISSS